MGFLHFTVLLLGMHGYLNLNLKCFPLHTEGYNGVEQYLVTFFIITLRADTGSYTWCHPYFL